MLPPYPGSLSPAASPGQGPASPWEQGMSVHLSAAFWPPLAAGPGLWKGKLQQAMRDWEPTGGTWWGWQEWIGRETVGRAGSKKDYWMVETSCFPS